MKRVLLKYGLLSMVASAVLSALLTAMVLGEATAKGAVAGALLSGLSFVALIYSVTGMLEDRASTRQKAFSGLMLVGKFAVVGLLFWYVLLRLHWSPMGVAMGVGVSILGFTVAMNRAMGSPDGQSAMKEEEARIAAEADAQD